MATSDGSRQTRRRRRKRIKNSEFTQFSQWMVADIRPLLWIVTVGGLALAFYCVRQGYLGGLPWIVTLVGLPWSAHGVVCACYLNMCKSDHSEGGITFESAKAKGFVEDPSWESPAI